jgi:hypothetical protein
MRLLFMNVTGNEKHYSSTIETDFNLDLSRLSPKLPE